MMTSLDSMSPMMMAAILKEWSKILFKLGVIMCKNDLDRFELDNDFWIELI